MHARQLKCALIGGRSDSELMNRRGLYNDMGGACLIVLGSSSALQIEPEEEEDVILQELLPSAVSRVVIR